MDGETRGVDSRRSIRATRHRRSIALPELRVLRRMVTEPTAVTRVVRSSPEHLEHPERDEERTMKLSDPAVLAYLDDPRLLESTLAESSRPRCE
jgi:hypothetical protein